MGWPVACVQSCGGTPLIITADHAPQAITKKTNSKRWPPVRASESVSFHPSLPLCCGIFLCFDEPKNGSSSEARCQAVARHAGFISRLPQTSNAEHFESLPPHTRCTPTEQTQRRQRYRCHRYLPKSRVQREAEVRKKVKCTLRQQCSSPSLLEMQFALLLLLRRTRLCLCPL